MRRFIEILQFRIRSVFSDFDKFTNEIHPFNKCDLMRGFGKFLNASGHRHDWKHNTSLSSRGCCSVTAVLLWSCHGRPVSSAIRQSGFSPERRRNGYGWPEPIAFLSYIAGCSWWWRCTLCMPNSHNSKINEIVSLMEVRSRCRT